MNDRTNSLGISRNQVFQVIDKERSYQNNLNPHCMAVGDELVLLRAYLRKAENCYTERFGDDHERPAMDVMRKLAGICVRCMENHGAVPRK